MMKPHSIATALIGCVAMLLGLTPAAQAADRPVDVFIGDSSAVQGPYSDGTTPAQRWTRLFADADGTDEVNVAVSGTGFVVGGASTFAKQADKAIAATKNRNVRRVFVVGIGNDMSAQSRGDITGKQISQALLATMPKIAAAWPQAQKLYVPEASPMTANMRAAYQRMSPYMPDIYQGVKLVGFTSLERWDTMVDGNGTSKDGTHLNRKGNNLMAHAMQQWVNTLDGPKNAGIIPAWGDGTITLDAATFPDKTLRDWLKTVYDKDGDGKASVKDITYIGPHPDDGARHLPVDIEDPTGIDLLTALNELSINGDKPTSGRLDLSNAVGLERLNIDAQTTDAAPLTIALPAKAPHLTQVLVDSTNLVGLDSTGDYPKLSRLALTRGDMTSVDVTGMPELTSLTVEGSNITTPDLTRNPKLTDIHLSLLADVDADRLSLDAKPDLTRVYLSADDLTSIRTRLERLPNVTYMSLSGKLDSFDATSLTSLKTLDMTTNLRSLDLRGSTVTKFLGTGLVAVAADDTTTVDLDGQPHIDDASLDLSTLPGIDPAKFDMTAGTIRDGRMYPPVDGSQAGYTYHTGSPQSATAMWVDFNAYWVHYDLGYDGRTLDPMPVKAKGAAIRPADPTRPGYTFAGWTQGGKPYDFSTPVSRVTWHLTASWRKNESKPAAHTVTFDSGENASKVESQTVEQGKPVAKPQDPTRDGYEFKGWTLDGKAYDFSKPVTQDLTLTAAWSKKEAPKPVMYTVTFDPNRQGMSVPPQTVRDGGTATPVTLDSGLDENGSTYWLFSGWTLDGKPFDFTTPVTRDITLVAAWGVMPSERVTVTFAGDGVDVPAQRLDIGEKAAKPADPKREGYTFDGWTLDGGPYDFATPVTHDLTLLAVWSKTGTPTPSPASHTVRFDTAGGPNIPDRTVENGKPVAKPKDPKRDGYEFKEWTLDGKAYDFSAPVVHDLTLTAVWTPAGDDAEPAVHTVAFDTGSNRFARTVAHGGRVARPADPTRPGWTFTGWRLDGKPYDFSTPVIADITLTATWTKRESATPASEPALPATGASIIPLALLVIGMLAAGGTILYLAHRKHQ